MERFNTTREGYRYDKLIFWGFALIMFALVAILIAKYGIASRPYFNCNTVKCLNPFWTNSSFSCTYLFGFVDCPIQDYDWLNREFLDPGEYGEKDKTAGAGYLMFGLLVLAFVLNHILHNRGKAPSIDPPWARKFQKNKKFMELFDDDKEPKD